MSSMHLELKDATSWPITGHPGVSCEGVLLHSSGVLLPFGGCLWDASVALPSGGNH